MSNVLMALGPFTFSMASFSYEDLKRQHAARIAPQEIVGARPSLHRMGFDNETLTIGATFFPFYLGGASGLSQVSAMRAAVGTSYPLVGNQGVVGLSFGRWLLHRVGDTQDYIGPTGVGQRIEVSIDLMFDGRTRTPGALSLLGLGSLALGGQ